MGKTRKIGAIDYIAYACSTLVYILPQYLLSSFLSAYYTDVALISAGAVGSVILFMRVTDGINDLIVGRMIDHTNTEWGKARSWIFAGSIGVTLSMLFIFHVPSSLGSGAKVAWLAVTYFLLMVVFATMEGVANSTLMVYLTNDTQKRNKFGASNMAGTYVREDCSNYFNFCTFGNLGLVCLGLLLRHVFRHVWQIIVIMVSINLK